MALAATLGGCNSNEVYGSPHSYAGAPGSGAHRVATILTRADPFSSTFAHLPGNQGQGVTAMSNIKCRVALGAVAAWVGLFACSRNGASACLASALGSDCFSCMQTSCGPELANLE